PTPSVFTRTRWNSWNPRRSVCARRPRTVCAGMVAEEPVVIAGGAPFYGVRHATKGPLGALHPVHTPSRTTDGAPVWYSRAVARSAHMARGERRRSLSVVGGARGEVSRYASLLPDSGGPALVLGVADGRLAEALVRRGVTVTGVDPSPRM